VRTRPAAGVASGAASGSPHLRRGEHPKQDGPAILPTGARWLRQTNLRRTTRSRRKASASPTRCSAIDGKVGESPSTSVRVCPRRPVRRRCWSRPPSGSRGRIWPCVRGRRRARPQGHPEPLATLSPPLRLDPAALEAGDYATQPVSAAHRSAAR